MAMWQFELDPIAAQAAVIDGVPAIHLGPEARDTIPLRLSPDQCTRLGAAIGEFLPAAERWSPGLMVWGNTRGSDVQIYLDKEDDGALKIRIDAQTFTTELVEAFCDLATEFGWVFLTVRGAVLPPQPESVLRALLNSPARRFVENPTDRVAQLAARMGRPN